MNGLRWTLGLVTTLLLVVYLFLLVAADSFRSSFGASANGPLKAIVPLAIGAILLAGMMMPERRLLLHVGAVTAVGLVAGSLWIARETTFMAGLGICYSAGWLIWYYVVAWRGPIASPTP